MTDPIPVHHNRLGVALGYVFHPFVLFFPVAAVVLSEQTPTEALAWIVLMATITILPTGLLLTYRQRQGQPLYLRHNRLPLYITAWFSTLVCGLVLSVLAAPDRLLQCTLTIALWLPVQTFINQRYTKISSHAAFSAGMMVGLAWFGELPTLPTQAVAVLVVLLTAWARYVTHHHTLTQILLGWGVAVSVVSLSLGLLT